MTKKSGFSLVELSIVLVILGLLVGGVLTGQNLIKAAVLRSVTTELQNYQTAVAIFKEKYTALPGDMANATSYWGRADTGAFSGQCAAPDTDTGTAPQTCNGDGSGKVRDNGAAGKTNEMFRFWQQLANEGLIAGKYTGVAGSGGVFHSILGTNVPASKYPNGGWSINDLPNYAGAITTFKADYGNHFMLAAASTVSLPNFPLLLPEEAWNIDIKMDDGKPGTGSVIAYQWSACTFATAETQTDVDYRLSTTAASCGLLFPRSL